MAEVKLKWEDLAEKFLEWLISIESERENLRNWVGVFKFIKGDVVSKSASRIQNLSFWDDSVSIL